MNPANNNPQGVLRRLVKIAKGRIPAGLDADLTPAALRDKAIAEHQKKLDAYIQEVRELFTLHDERV